MERYGKWKILKNTNQSKKLGQTIIKNPDLILLGLDPTLNQQTRLGGKPGPWEAPLGGALGRARKTRPLPASRLPNWHGQFKVIDFLEEQPERWLSMGLIGYSNMFRMVNNLTEPYGRSLKKDERSRTATVAQLHSLCPWRAVYKCEAL